ncbi:nucleoside hydrolase [Leucobacter sp. USHLN153]|uniref:nucleoside hydrolase n=1 Tax=Leucobacter sp. USHLN153 TaxID=3081268 RepID=UPI003017859A
MPSHAIPLFLDCDPGIDDAIAIAYALCQSDVELVGIAASGGNVSTEQVVQNTLGWLELAGRSDLPVYRGSDLPLAGQDPHVPEAPDGQSLVGVGELADHGGGAVSGAGGVEYAEVTHGDTGAGYAALPHPSFGVRDMSAAQAWVDAARAHPGELIGVVIGPSTNLALALEMEPDLPRLVKRLFVMGGAFNYRGNTHPTTEWNITYDPEAAARVFASFGAALAVGDALHAPVIGPLEATEMVEMTPERLSRILSMTSEEALASASESRRRWAAVLHELGEALRFYFEFHEQDGHGYLAHTHDPYVMAAAIGWARAEAEREARAGDAADVAAESRGARETATIPWAETAYAPVDVELTGTLTRGETVADWLGRWNRPANAEIVRRVDAAQFLDHLAETLMKGPDHEHTR